MLLPDRASRKFDTLARGIWGIPGQDLPTLGPEELGDRAALIERTAGLTKALVAIVSYNTRGHLVDCLNSVVPQATAFDSLVVVVDNASFDGSQDMVRSAFPTVRLVPLASNVGFGKANNIAVARFEHHNPSYILLVNSDAVLPPAGLSQLINYGDRHPEFGAVACTLRNSDGVIERSCTHFPSLWRRAVEALGFHRFVRGIGLQYREWPFPAEREVENASAACLLVRTAAWQMVNGFDERFFMYYEDTDLCHRLIQHGVRIVYWPGINVLHHFSGSSPTAVKKAELYLVSQTMAYKQWYGIVGAVIVQILEAAYTAIYTGELWYRWKVKGQHKVAARLTANWYTLRWICSGRWRRLLA